MFARQISVEDVLRVLEAGETIEINDHWNAQNEIRGLVRSLGESRAA